MRVAFLSAALSLACHAPPSDGLHPLGDDWGGPSGTFRESLRDDFDGPAGSAPNEALWNVEEREFGFNHERDYNTRERENSFLDGQGHLVLQALRKQYEKPDGTVSEQPYTSARLTSIGKIEPTYGRFEMRVKLPSGKGLWPAFWLLGTSIDELGWPQCGELDVFELRGSVPNEIHGSMHGPGYSLNRPYSRSYQLPSGSFADDFHVFALEWTPEGIRWLVDGSVYHARTPEGLRERDTEWVFDHPMYVILNLAVGGTYDGDPDAATPLPAQMIVDYVSVSEYVP